MSGISIDVKDVSEEHGQWFFIIAVSGDGGIARSVRRRYNDVAEFDKRWRKNVPTATISTKLPAASHNLFAGKEETARKRIPDMNAYLRAVAAESTLSAELRKFLSPEDRASSLAQSPSSLSTSHSTTRSFRKSLKFLASSSSSTHIDTTDRGSGEDTMRRPLPEHTVYQGYLEEQAKGTKQFFFVISNKAFYTFEAEPEKNSTASSVGSNGGPFTPPPLKSSNSMSSLGLMQEASASPASGATLSPNQSIRRTGRSGSLNNGPGGIGIGMVSAASALAALPSPGSSPVSSSGGSPQQSLPSPTAAGFINVPGMRMQRRLDLLDLFSVEQDVNNKKQFSIFSFDNSIQKQKLMGAIGMSVSFGHVAMRVYYCTSELQCTMWCVVLESLIRENWQRLCEKQFMAAPEIFQFREFVLKGSGKGRTQHRMVAASDTFLYNVDTTHHPVAIKEVRWGAWLGSVKALTRTSYTLTVYLDLALAAQHPNKNTKSASEKRKDHYSFICRTDEACTRLCTEITRLCFQVTNKMITITVLEDTEDDRVLQNRGDLQQAGEDLVLETTMEKFTNQGAKRHGKIVSVFENLKIEWGDQKKRLREQIVSVERTTSPEHVSRLLPQLIPAEDTAHFERILVIQTTGKTLLLRALSKEEAARWESVISGLLAKRK